MVNTIEVLVSRSHYSVLVSDINPRFKEEVINAPSHITRAARHRYGFLKMLEPGNDKRVSVFTEAERAKLVPKAREIFGAHINTVAEAIDALRTLDHNLNPVSLDMPIHQSDGSSDLTMGDTVSVSGAAHDSAQEEYKKDLIKKRLMEVLRVTLSEKEYRVITRRRGLADGTHRTLEELSEEEGITRQAISQIEQRCFRKLRNRKGKILAELWMLSR